ncbi:DNA damage-regulated autophagy modulator protein 2 [Sarcoptes scabiei]|uniref:DNA damage-regulated autophagy modulator protein 2 n=1 Tax=Sarcoptes scabiei TaxID=52283 RepID=A0A834R761_SARSC|nr:DNA damage-regulated autophagy modulator protein 2 [Sarcoptes scabiei]
MTNNNNLNANDRAADISITIPEFKHFKHRIYCRLKNYVWLFPLLTTILIPSSCLVPYWASVKHEFLHPLLPYVSDAGSGTPGANYFSQLIDMCSLLILITAWIRYKQIKFYLDQQIEASKKLNNTKAESKQPEEEIKNLSYINWLAMIFASICAFGGILTGNFRMTEFLIVHMLSASLLFGFMLIYLLCMSYLTLAINRNYRYETLPISMIIISLIDIVFILIFVLAFFLSVSHLDLNTFSDPNFRLFWPREDEGFETHCLSAMFEWIGIMIVSLFYLSLSRRMRKFKDWQSVRF